MSDGAPLRRAAVLGAGTMGAGIAQVLAQAGAEVRLVDVDAAAVERGLATIATGLERAAARGKLSEAEAAAARERVSGGCDLSALAGCELAVEAVPERLELKREVMARLAQACGEEAILATNTSSLLVSAVAAEVPRPERVVGLHFFNPPPAMELVEVVPGARTEQEVTARATELMRAAGKRPVVVRDGIGFLVNRCARPFYGEAFKLVAEGVATVEQVDRVCRLGGGFRMGPFELIDLIGVEVNFEIARSFFEQSFGEPRWQPSTLQARMVAAGLHGRKSGRGFYDYGGGDGAHRPADPPAPPVGGGEGRTVAIVGDGPLSHGLARRAVEAGFSLEESDSPWLVLDTSVDGAWSFGWDAPCAVLCARRSLRERDQRGAAGFHVLTGESTLAELTSGPATEPASLERARWFFTAIGAHVEEVGDAPGLVLGRIVAQLVNEGAFAVDEGVAAAADVDLGMTLGLRHPHGPGGWLDVCGSAHVRAVLDGLWNERRDPRYRPARGLPAAT